MSSIVVAGDTSGTITIAAPAVAGSGTLTLPVATDTLAGIAATQTLTNKTLVAPALGTPASGVLTNCTGVAAAALPAGSVLQVVNATNATTTTNSTQTYVDTGLTATITPRSTSSKVLVFVTHASLNKNAGNALNDLKINLCRNAVQIVELVSSLGYTATAVQNWLSFSTQYLDSPATTSATTYKTQFANADVAAALVAVNNGGGGSTMTLMEIQG